MKGSMFRWQAEVLLRHSATEVDRRCRINPTVHVHRNRESGDFVLSDYAFNPETGFISGSGNLVWISAGEMQAKCDALILESLQGFPERIFVRSDAADWSEQARAKFRDEHSELRIWLKSPKLLILQPLRRVPGKKGSIGETSDAVSVDLPTSSQELWRLLIMAFERCQPMP